MQEQLHQVRPLWASVIFCAFTVGCGGGSGDPNDKCQLENHCIRTDDEVRCEEGYDWENPRDEENFNCVLSEDPCEDEGLYNDGVCDNNCLNPDPDCGSTGDGDGDGDISTGDGDGDGDGIGDGDGDGDVVLPPDPQHPDGPRILEFSANIVDITEGGTVSLSAIVTDPDGVEDIIAGTLVDATDTEITYGAFDANEGSFELQLGWYEVNQVRPIDFTTEALRTFRARFFDVAGHVISADIEITFSCDGSAACDGSCGQARCGEECVYDDFNTEENCGGCGISCGEGGQCDAGQCTCPSWLPDTCGGGCFDLTSSADNCGACGTGCSAGSCSSGRCDCDNSNQCGGSTSCIDSSHSGLIGQCHSIGNLMGINSSEPFTGVAVLQLDGVQVPVCEKTDSSMHEVICRDLYGPESTVVSATSYDWPTGTDMWIDPTCEGTENELKNCELRVASYCSFDDAQQVTCTAPPDPEPEPEPDPEPDPGGGWTCDITWQTDSYCDCGCGVPDTQCGTIEPVTCEYTFCDAGTVVDPTDHSECIPG